MRKAGLGSTALLGLLLPAPLAAQARRLSESSKAHASVREAFRQTVSEVRASTVRILSGGDQAALGTVVDPGGRILTKASEIGTDLSCVLADGRELPARLLGMDDESDLALLAVDTSLPAVQWSDRTLRPGLWLATPGLDELPVAVGVLSREAHVRPLGSTPRVELGIRLRRSRRRAEVARVEVGSPAAKAGLEVGDVIVWMDEDRIRSSWTYYRILRRYEPGDEILFAIDRNGRELERAIEVRKSEDRRGPRNPQEPLWGPLSEVRAGFPEVLQHDTVLRPNQCGGPLVDLSGKAVGINIARAGRSETLALPKQVVLEVIEKLERAASAAGGRRKRAANAAAGEDRRRRALAFAADAARRAQHALAAALERLEEAQKSGDPGNIADARRALELVRRTAREARRAMQEAKQVRDRPRR